MISSGFNVNASTQIVERQSQSVYAGYRGHNHHIASLEQSTDAAVPQRVQLRIHR